MIDAAARGSRCGFFIAYTCIMAIPFSLPDSAASTASVSVGLRAAG
jgi:hypothetical protein